MRNKPPVHPGIVIEGHMARCAIDAVKLAAALTVPVRHVAQIISGDRNISADMACRLGRFFGNSPLYWLALQNDYDLALVDRGQIERDVTPPVTALPLTDPPGSRGPSNTPKRTAL